MGAVWAGASRGQSHQRVSFPFKAVCSSLRAADSYVMDEEPGFATASRNGCPRPGVAKVERCNFAASYQLSASVNNIIKHNQCYIKHYVNAHVPRTVLGALTLML